MAKHRPDELSDVWDTEAQKAWDALEPRQQAFFVEYLNNGYRANKAYVKTYNKDADDSVARACGSRLLSNANIQALCAKLSQSKATDLLKIKKVYADAMEAEALTRDGDGKLVTLDLPDHKIRLEAAEKLAKLNGELSDRVKIDMDGSKEFIDLLRGQLGKV